MKRLLLLLLLIPSLSFAGGVAGVSNYIIIGDGWYECSFMTAATPTQLTIVLVTDTGTTYQGDGTSGNDTGLLINMTDTLSPGTSVGGLSKFTVSNVGTITIYDSYTDASDCEGYSFDTGVTTANTFTIKGNTADTAGAVVTTVKFTYD